MCPLKCNYPHVVRRGASVRKKKTKEGEDLDEAATASTLAVATARTRTSTSTTTTLLKNNQLSNPSAGSANSPSSLSALWGYILPALDHLMRSPTNDELTAASIDIEYHVGIYTASYDYINSRSESKTQISISTTTTIASNSNISHSNAGSDIYQQLDIYFAQTARDLLLAAPQDDSTLIHYIIPSFNRYLTGSRSVNHLLNYVNRHFVKRAVAKDIGWLHVNDVLESTTKSDDKISKELRERRFDKLKKWCYLDGASSDLITWAKACAEAASLPDRVVPISSLALRRFRIEFFEPLLTVPKLAKKTKPKNRLTKLSTGSRPSGPKGRLARAVEQLLESSGGDEEERTRHISQLSAALESVGIRSDNLLRRELDQFVATLPMVVV